VIKARIVPRQDRRWLSVLPVIAFAGIADPNKFFATLGTNGARVLAKHSFGDHHHFTNREAGALLKEAEERKAMLVTTEKDFVRLSTAQREGIRMLKVAAVFDDAPAMERLLASIVPRA
jgi:tetraacyldisaccharide 4'-kinase